MRRTDQPRRGRVWAALMAALVASLLVHPRLAPASVEEQRARLPPPARDCPDPIEGSWEGREWFRGHWYRFTLEIQRRAPGDEALVGTIWSHSWRGDEALTEPPECGGEGSTGRETRIAMNARGTFIQGTVDFEGYDWEVRDNVCGTFTGVYYPDRFSGALEREGTEFRSVSEDGHNPDGVVVFRRIRCGPAPDKPIPELPPRRPSPNYARGCGGCF